jgi:DNA-binding NarL/FixJ family response regulator
MNDRKRMTPSKSKRIAVLLAEDNKIVRKGVRKLLGAEDDLRVVGEAKDGRQAVKMTRRLRPAVVVSGDGQNPPGRDGQNPPL